MDRSRFKATSIKDLEKQDARINELGISGLTGSGSGSERLVLHTIEEGKNLFRIYPANPDFEGSLPFETKVINFLPIDVPVYKDGKPVEGKFERKNKPVFNAKVHGGAKIDLVEEYIKFVEKLAAEQFTNDEDKTEFLAPIYGNNFSGGEYWGILPQISYICYADKYENGTPTFGRLEFKKAVRFGINKVSAIESSDEPIGTTVSCFTDIDKARLCIINYSKKAQPKDKYQVFLDSSTDEDDRIKRYPLTDAQISKLLEVEPLINYRSYFKRRDLEFQLEGLKNVDEQYGFGVFEYDEFLEIVESIVDLYPEDEQPKEQEKETKTKASSKPSLKKESEETDSKEDDEKPAESTQDRIARIRSLRNKK